MLAIVAIERIDDLLVLAGAQGGGDQCLCLAAGEQGRAVGARQDRRRVLIGTYVLSAGYYDAYYLKAQRVRRLIRDEFEQVFRDVDAILTPTTPEAAFAIGEKTDDPIAMYLNDVFTVPGDLSGIPGISVPAGRDADGLPLGLQVMTRSFDEATMFRAAAVLEAAAGFEAAPEPWWRSAP